MTARRAPPSPLAPVPANDAARPAPPADLSRTAALFGAAKGPETATAQTRIGLAGVITVGGNGSGIALLSLGGRPAEVYRAGEVIGASGWSLARVGADRVWLRREDRAEEVVLPTKPAADGIVRR